VAEGLRWFLANRLLRLLALVVASLAFCQAMALSMLVLYGTRDLHLGHAGYGVFLAVAAAGNVAGALGAGRAHVRLGTSGCIVGAAGAAAAGYLVMAGTHSVVLAAAALIIEGVAVAVGNVTTLSLRQRIIPSALLGRVGSAFRMLIFGLVPVGALVGGLISSAMGIRAAFVTAGVVQVGVVALAAPALVRRVHKFEGA
jgi:MFS family permease